jgi:hypothetical protein
MKTALEILNKHISQELIPSRQIVNINIAMKEYAQEIAIAFGKKLGLIGTSYRATSESEQWEYITKAGELDYSTTEDLYKEFIK